MRKWLAMLLSLLMLFSLAACGEGSGGGGGGSTEPPEGYDAEYTIYVNDAEKWTPFPGKSGVSFALSDSNAVSASDDGTTITFTGKQVGETVITATLDGTESKALVRVREMEADGARYYITYNQPISNYTYEIGGGPDNGGIRYTFDGFSRKDYYRNDDGALIESWDNMDGWYGFICEGEIGEEAQHEGEERLFAQNLFYWPCSEFACWLIDADYDNDGNVICYSPNTPMYEAYADDPQRLPDNVDVTSLYVRNEEVCGVDCYVLKITSGQNYFYWVDPNTGWTLQYAIQEYGSDELKIRGTVTFFEIGTP